VLRELWAAPSEERHGYDLAKKLRSHQSAYAIFRKLEGLGLVSSRWDEVDGHRRRYYRLTGPGADLCREVFPGTSDA
jgi:DNA-binding PadR family transcriptional regulator